MLPSCVVTSRFRQVYDVMSPQVQKIFSNGRLLIIRDGVAYDAWGHIVDVK